MTMGGVRRLAFLDKESEARAWLGGRAGDPAGHVAVALKPSVRAFLKEQGAEALSTVGFFPNAAHAGALEGSDRLARWLRDHAEWGDPRLGIREAYRESLIFQVRLVAHYCMWLIEIILNAIERYRPAAVSASLAGARRASCYCAEPEENWAGRLLDSIARRDGLAFEDLAGAGSGRWDRSSKRALSRAGALLKFLIRYGMTRAGGAVSTGGAGSPSTSVLFTTRAYGMDALAGRIRETCPDVPVGWLGGPLLPPAPVAGWLIRTAAGRRGDDLFAQKAALDALAEAVKGVPELFSHRGISFAALVSEKIRAAIADRVIGLRLWAPALDRALASARPRAVISCGNRGDELVLAELCAKHGIPEILVSHGSHVRPRSAPERIEWGEHGRGFLRLPVSHLALASPLAEGYLEAFACPGKPVRTGPLTWGMPVGRTGREALLEKLLKGQGVPRDVRVVLHAGTPKSTNTPRLYVYETADEYIQSLCDLAAAVARVPRAILVIKFRPTDDLGIGDIRTLVPLSERVILETERSFGDLLGPCDLLVSFSSTTIEEALQNRIPVLLYGGDGRYQHVPAHEIRADEPVAIAAAYHARAAEDLPYAIRQILDIPREVRLDTAVFDPYVYPAEVCVSLSDLVGKLA